MMGTAFYQRQQFRGLIATAGINWRAFDYFYRHRLKDCRPCV